MARNSYVVDPVEFVAVEDSGSGLAQSECVVAICTCDGNPAVIATGNREQCDYIVKTIRDAIRTWPLDTTRSIPDAVAGQQWRMIGGGDIPTIYSGSAMVRMLEDRGVFKDAAAVLICVEIGAQRSVGGFEYERIS